MENEEVKIELPDNATMKSMASEFANSQKNGGATEAGRLGIENGYFWGLERGCSIASMLIAEKEKQMEGLESELRQIRQALEVNQGVYQQNIQELKYQLSPLEQDASETSLKAIDEVLAKMSKEELDGLIEKIEVWNAKVSPADPENDEDTYEDLYRAIAKINAGHYGSAKNFIERYINTAPVERKEHGINLAQIEKNIDDALSKETSESMTNWLLNKRKDRLCKCECPSGRETDEHYNQICTTCGRYTSTPNFSNE